MKKFYFLFALIALLAFAPACSHHHHHHHGNSNQIQGPVLNPGHHHGKPGHHGPGKPGPKG